MDLQRYPMQASFHGQFSHKLNANNQLALPRAFMAEIEYETEDNAKRNGFIVILPDTPCAYFFTRRQWLEKYNGITRRRSDFPSAADYTNFLRDIQRYVFPVGFDKTGRITVPAPVREKLDISRDVVLIGMDSRIEIWPGDADAARREATGEHSASVMNDFRSIFEDVDETWD